MICMQYCQCIITIVIMIRLSFTQLELKQDNLSMKQCTLGRIEFFICQSHVKMYVFGGLDGMNITHSKKIMNLLNLSCPQEAQRTGADWHKVLCSHTVTAGGRKSGWIICWHMFLELLAILVSTFLLRVSCFNDKNVHWKLQPGKENHFPASAKSQVKH